MIVLLLFTIGKIFKADIDETTYIMLGALEIFVLDWLIIIGLFT